MSGLVGGYVIAGFILLSTILSGRGLERRVEEGTESDRQDLRRFAEARTSELFAWALAFLCVVGGIVQVARAQPLGWAWFGAAATYVAAVVVSRRQRRRLLELLGDRGRVERGPVHDRGARRSTWFGVAAVVGWAGTRAVGYVDPSPLSDAGIVAYTLSAIVMAIGALGFLVVRTRMYLRGDDLPGTPTRDG